MCTLQPNRLPSWHHTQCLCLFWQDPHRMLSENQWLPAIHALFPGGASDTFSFCTAHLTLTGKKNNICRAKMEVCVSTVSTSHMRAQSESHETGKKKNQVVHQRAQNKFVCWLQQDPWIKMNSATSNPQTGMALG